MGDILLFAGTTEGRKAAEFLSLSGIKTDVLTATEYGKQVIDKSGDFINVISGRLNENEMEKLMIDNMYKLVVDATHPFAKNVTENIQTACKNTQTEYIRLLRNDLDIENLNCIYVKNHTEAVEYLKNKEGNVFLTTGSNNIEAYTAEEGLKGRIFVRVLPLAESLDKCIKSGINPKHIMCMQGPFSQEFNIACIKETNSKFIVTKQTGAAGGFYEKISAAVKSGAKAVVIKAPEEKGVCFDEFKNIIINLFNVKIKKKKTVNLVSAGMGKRELLTMEALKAVENSSLVIGSKRVLESFDLYDKKIKHSINSYEIKNIIDENADTNISVVFSGDIGFYSGAEKLASILNEENYCVNKISGISSYVYFLDKINKTYRDVLFLSMHGRDINFVDAVKTNYKTLVLLGGENDVSRICTELAENNMKSADIFIGENLSYNNEKISTGKAEDFVNYKNNRLSVIYIENPEAARRIYSFGLSDDLFERNSVPMTKSEVRAVSISKLMLSENSVVYDLGSGTGSVSIECALMAFKGKVFSVDKNENAIECLNNNISKFGISNINVIKGEAPECLKDIAAPTHCFIGGSSGKLFGIVKTVLEKNSKTRFVINAITLETVLEAKKAALSLDCKNLEIINISASRAKNIGDLSLMMGLNPVFIISFTGKGD